MTDAISTLNANIGSQLAKVGAILNLLPQINNVILTSLVQIDNLLPQAGFNPAKVAAVATQVQAAVAAANQTFIAIEDLVPIITNFATSILGIVDQAKAAAVAATTTATTAAAAATGK